MIWRIVKKRDSDVLQVWNGDEISGEPDKEYENDPGHFNYSLDKSGDVQQSPSVLEENGAMAETVDQRSNIKARLLTKAETPESEGGWGWSRLKLRTVRQEEGLFFDFLDANNYEEAKKEATDSDNLTDSETQWIHDLLDGVL
jgi:hypothetical protein